MTRTGAEEAAKVRPKPIMNLRLRSVSPGFAQSSTNDVPSTNEHADRLRRGLQDGCCTHDKCTKHNSCAPPVAVRKVWREWIRCETADILYSIQ